MAAKTSTCVALACNTCGEYLSPDDDGEAHYADLPTAITVARTYGWIVQADGFAICDTEDAEHSAAIRELMPLEPVPVCDGQTEIPFADSVTVLAAPAELDVYTAPKLREAVIEAVQAGHYLLVVDMAATTYLDSTGMGVLVGALKRTAAFEGWVRLAGASGKVARQLRICGLDRVFVIADTVEGAINHETEGATQT